MFGNPPASMLIPLAPLPPLFGGYKMDYKKLAAQMNNEPLHILEELCSHPVLHVNAHFRKENKDEDAIYVVTLSNASPIISENREAIWRKSDLAIDLFYDPNLTLDSINSDSLAVVMHWVKLFCSMLTFRGHEVFLDNQLFRPYE